MFDPDTFRAITMFATVQRLMFELEAAERRLGSALRHGEINMEMYRSEAAEIEAAFEADRRDLR